MVLTHLQDEIKKEIDAHYALDCCIAATRIALDVLDHFQIPARPVTTRLLICNSVFREWVERFDKLPQTAEEREEVFGAGGWTLLVGAEKATVRPSKGRGFGGHLVAYLDEGYLVDLSVPQANRPRHNIRLRPLVARMPGFMQDRGVTFKYPQKDGDLLLSYTVIENEAYTASIYWQSDRRKVVSYPAIAALDQLLRAEDGSAHDGTDRDASQFGDRDLGADRQALG